MEQARKTPHGHGMRSQLFIYLYWLVDIIIPVRQLPPPPLQDIHSMEQSHLAHNQVLKFKEAINNLLRTYPEPGATNYDYI
jgi:hypothetical protein